MALVAEHETTAPDLAADETAPLRARADQVAAQLTEIDEALQAAEAERDAALDRLVELQGQPAGASAIPRWRAEEARDGAQERIAALLARRAPLAAEAGRLNGFLEPIERRRRELADDRLRLARWERIAAVMPLVDQLVAAFSDAMQGSRDAPPSLNGLASAWGQGGWTRLKVDGTIESTVTGLRDKIARMEAGL